jgi:Fe-S-cluster containining protein
MACTPKSGTCDQCVSACLVKPGWFLPGEAERVAEHLGLTLEELFETKLAVDWWEDTGEGDIFLLSPAIHGELPGTEFPATPNGKCVFLTEDGKCSIHEVKPHECRQYWCGEEEEGAFKRHRETALAWLDHQDQPAELLGREPEKEESLGGLFSWLGLGSLYD